jgi:hypothetical protein
MDWDIAPYFAVSGILGAAIGISEIVSRYRDDPLQALKTPPALLYIALNAGASLAALYLVRTLPSLAALGGDASTSDAASSKMLIQSLASGLSAMALFRSSIFTIRVANADIGIGPAAFLQILLGATDRETDRARAKPRAVALEGIMKGISYARAKQALPALCFGLMQGLSAEEQAAFSSDVVGLDASAMDDVFKSYSLGLALMNLVGERVLREAVRMLRTEIGEKPKPIVQSIQTLQLLQDLDFDHSAQSLAEGCIFVANKMDDRDTADRVAEDLRRISGLAVSGPRKVLLLSAALVARFGEDIVQIVLKSLAEKPAMSH